MLDSLIGGTFASWWALRVITTRIIEVTVKFLVPCFVVDIRDSGYFYTLTRVLLVHVLESIFVKVNGCRSKTLGCHLCLLMPTASNLTW